MWSEIGNGQGTVMAPLAIVAFLGISSIVGEIRITRKCQREFERVPRYCGCRRERMFLERNGRFVRDVCPGCGTMTETPVQVFLHPRDYRAYQVWQANRENREPEESEPASPG